LESTALTLVKQEKFGELECDFYKKDDEFYMTRDQIGEALEYIEPRIAIYKIHTANKDRLDRFSTVTKLVTVEGGREVVREVYLYSRKGYGKSAKIIFKEISSMDADQAQKWIEKAVWDKYINANDMMNLLSLGRII